MSTKAAHSPQLRAPSRRAQVWLAILALALPGAVVLVAMGMALTTAQRDGADVWIAIAALLGSLLFCAVVFVVLRRFMARQSLIISDGGLTVTTSFYSRHLTLAELDLSKARLVNLDERTELKPLMKTNGFFVPGYRSGWFRLRNLQRALVAMTDGPKVLWLPTHKGYHLMLEVEQPQQLLTMLNDLASGVRPTAPR